MENQPTKLDKAVKISVIAGALIVALSIAYYFAFRPLKKQSDIKECYKRAIDIVNWDGKGSLPLYSQKEFKDANDMCITEKGW
jgi:hypothetical protein